MKAQGIFIAGTDTGVGKTVVGAAILCGLRANGVDAVPMKPIQTGCVRRGGVWHAPDLEFCLRAAGLRPQPEELDLMAPYCLKKPCSPHLAAAMMRRKIDPRRITDAFRALSKRHELVVVEGAGGLLAPIGGDKFMLDLMTALALPVILVARPGLGTINHTLLSLRELRRAGLDVLGVIFNQTAPARWGRIEADNVKTIARLGGVRVLGHLPFIPEIGRGSARRFSVARVAGLPMIKIVVNLLDGAPLVARGEPSAIKHNRP